jgi:hypothetical protein
VKQMLWFGLGVAAGVVAIRKVSGAAHRLTPAGMAENVSDALRELATAVGSFGADVRAGMAEREAELRASIFERTGIDTATSTIGSSRPLGSPAPEHRARVTAG